MIFWAKASTFAGSSLINRGICCFSLFFMTVNEESGFWTTFENVGLWAHTHTLTTSSYGFLSLVWNTFTGLHRALTWTPSNTFGTNWATDSEPDLITHHPCLTSLMLLWINVGNPFSQVVASNIWWKQNVPITVGLFRCARTFRPRGIFLEAKVHMLFRVAPPSVEKTADLWSK